MNLGYTPRAAKMVNSSYGVNRGIPATANL